MTKQSPRALFSLLGSIALLVSCLPSLVNPRSAGAEPSSPAYPAYEFVNNGTSKLPWNAYNLSASSASAYPVADPAATATNNRLSVFSRLSSGALLQTVNDSLGGSYWNSYNLTAATHGLNMTASPAAINSADGGLCVATTAFNGHLVVYSLKPGGSWKSHDLTKSGRAPLVTGTASLTINASGNTVIAIRSQSNHLIVVSKNLSATPWWTVTDVTRVGGLSSITGPPSITLGPDGNQLWIAATLPGNKLGLFTNDNIGGRYWSSRTVGKPGKPLIVGGSPALTVFDSQLSGMVSSATGHLVKFSASSLSKPASWNIADLTVLTGSSTIQGRPSILIDGEKLRVFTRASYGDLVQYSKNYAVPSGHWGLRDVSVTAGSGRNIGNFPAPVLFKGEVHVFAGANILPAPTGTGVYAYPDPPGNTVAEGWKIIGSHGALGSCHSPYVGDAFGGADERVGKAIQSSNKRVTWLSFWTVSGPSKNAGGGCVPEADQSPAAFYRDGKAAGKWVATQIASYRSRGLALQPDWVILDPEGYPDNHSGLDTGLGDIQTQRWFQLLRGWHDGIVSVDASLKPGVYATMSEYRNYSLTNLTIPVFLAVAFGGGGPTLIDGARGPNVLGVIAWGAVCSLVTEQSRIFNGPPWNGRYNTIQFDAGVDCPPR
ncbi:MAG: hypothetical protein NT160_08050 [Actinobacteria bacterium]|nr:hypothetical protein [Actinomycetota bacterium]